MKKRIDYEVTERWRMKYLNGRYRKGRWRRNQPRINMVAIVALNVAGLFTELNTVEDICRIVKIADRLLIGLNRRGYLERKE